MSNLRDQIESQRLQSHRNTSGGLLYLGLRWCCYNDFKPVLHVVGVLFSSFTVRLQRHTRRKM